MTQEGTLNQGGSGNDTVFNYTGVFSSDTVKGLDGKDLISFANQTTAVTVRAYASAGSAGPIPPAPLWLPFTAELLFPLEVLRTVLTRLALLPCPLVPQLRSQRRVRRLEQSGLITIRERRRHRW